MAETAASYPGNESRCSQSVTYDAIGNITYDANGNVTGGNGLTYAYASFNKPTQITRGTTTIHFDHDPEHQRFRQLARGRRAEDIFRISRKGVSLCSLCEHRHDPFRTIPSSSAPAGSGRARKRFV